MSWRKSQLRKMVKMIAVWGSPGSGKTTLCMSLAAQLSQLNKNVVVISADTVTPALPVFLPCEEISDAGSLGELISKPVIGMSALKGFIHIHPKSERIGFMGLASGDTPMKYRSFKRDHMTSMLRVLNDSPFDYIVFDCQSNAVFDPLTQFALQISEFPLRLLTPDVKGIEFEKAQKWLKGVPDMRFDKHIRILSPLLKSSPVQEVKAQFGPFAYTLPFSDQVYLKSLSGELVCGCGDRFGIQYDKQVKKLAIEVVGD